MADQGITQNHHPKFDNSDAKSLLCLDSSALPIGIRVLLVLIACFTLPTVAFSQTSVTGTWPGTWSWTACSPAFNCSIGTVYTNVDMMLVQSGPNVTGSVFTGTGNTITGTLSGNSFSFQVDYIGRTDVFDTCIVQIVGNEMQGTCIAHYTAGPGAYTISASRQGTPPALSCPISTGMVNAPYASSFGVTGGTPPYTLFGITNGSLPPGLTLNQSGSISGTPTSTGLFSFTGIATDGSGATATATCGIAVAAPLITVGCPATTASVGSPYSSSATASSGLPPYTFSLSGGSLPNGLSLDGVSGTVTGTPSVSGSASFSVQATDTIGTSGVSSCSINVSTQPIVLGCPAGSGMVTVPYFSAFSASGGTGTFQSYSIIQGSLPTGLTLNSVGGISGVPTVAATYSFVGQVMDTSNQTSTATCSIAITPPPCTYSLSTPNSHFGQTGGHGAVNVTASDASCPVFASSPVDWVLISGPLPQYGSSTIYFDVQSNPGAQRQTGITVAGQDVPIVQDGGSCPIGGDISRLGVVDFKQCGRPFQTQWWDDGYDSTGTNICTDGCAMTALADLLSFSGYSYDPSTLNIKLKQLGSQGYTSSGLVVWDAVSIITAGHLHYQYLSAASDVDAELCSGRPVIFDVGGHFVVGTGKVGGLYTINDPGTVNPSTPISSFVSARAFRP